MSMLNLGLIASAWSTGLRAAVDEEWQRERLRSTAQALGLTPERADALLLQAQGLRAGSSPSAEDFAAARSLITIEAMGPAPTHPDPLSRLARRDPE
ncbi:hypothetical protein ACFXAF_12440 [Kitasatospora sp. NPDC059463]|uniref:hypothetical protein n=1 Tax=unclassified Kitasatospora TaxID=2633591 RepID=UPI00368B7327